MKTLLDLRKHKKALNFYYQVLFIILFIDIILPILCYCRLTLDFSYLVVHCIVMLAAMANDDKLLEQSGGVFLTSDIACHYGFTDIDGTVPRPLELQTKNKLDAPKSLLQ